MRLRLRGMLTLAMGQRKSTLDYFDKLLDGEKIDTLFNCEVTKIEKEGGYILEYTHQRVSSSKGV